MVFPEVASHLIIIKTSVCFFGYSVNYGFHPAFYNEVSFLKSFDCPDLKLIEQSFKTRIIELCFDEKESRLSSENGS